MHRKDVVNNTRLAGQTKRYHTWPILHEQTVAEHCWQVARIYTILFGQPSSDVAAYIQNHDTAEHITGDVPFPMKKNNPDLKEIHDRLEQEALVDMKVVLPEIGDVERHRVKISEMIEMWEFGVQELVMGNKLARPIIEECANVINSMTYDQDQIRRCVYDYMEIVGKWMM